METKRRRGRAPLPENPSYDARVDIRMPSEMRRQVRMAAAAADLSMGQWVKAAIEEKLSPAAECERYRQALLDIYAYRKTETWQDTTVAWHALLVEIPDIIERADVRDLPSAPDESFALES